MSDHKNTVHLKLTLNISVHVSHGPALCDHSKLALFFFLNSYTVLLYLEFSFFRQLDRIEFFFSLIICDYMGAPVCLKNCIVFCIMEIFDN